MRRRTAPGWRAAAAAWVLALAACSTSPGAPAPAVTSGSAGSTQGVPPLELASDHVLLDFDGVDPLAARTGGSTVEVRRRGDAPVRTTESGDGTRGLVFPPYAGSGEQRLVLLLTPVASAQQAPRPGELVFGADVQLDDSSGASTGDNGDNVVQRGLYADQNQYKLQVDRHVPSCTVRTPRLRAFVKLGHPIDDRWYRLSCHYDGVTLDLSAVPLRGGAADRTVASTPANAGPLSFAGSTGISVGGKVTSTGALVKTESDQFNGVLDNVFVSPSV